MTPRSAVRSIARRVPGASQLAWRLRAASERFAPFPLPRYVPGTPNVGGEGPLDSIFPPNPETLAAGALSEEALSFVKGVLSRLTQDQKMQRQLFFYGLGQGRFSGHWRFADILTVLRAAALFVRPSTYLEIGMLRGRSAAIVAATCPQCAIYGFDLWQPYGDEENPGPEYVRNELRAAGHRGPVELVVGDSSETVPAFIREHPDLFFDLITVDGDHSVRGAAIDLANTLPRLKVGGIMVFDDINVAPLLRRVWQKVIRNDARYLSWEFTDAGAGIAAAIRISDGPPTAPLYWRDLGPG